MNYKDIDTICFDMDGTIADLYNHPDWLSYFQNERSIFQYLEPLVPVRAFNALIEKLNTVCDVRIITWLPMGATKEYNNTCRQDKKRWVATFTPSIKKIHAIKYGSRKHGIRGLSPKAILFDDNKSVRDSWTKSGRIAFDEKNIFKILTEIYLSKIS